MSKSHNAFTTREVELLRAHWPTRMPIAEIVAMLPRHTENSIAGYALKKLGLKRPFPKRTAPAWVKVRALLAQRPMTQLELAAAMGFSRARASELLRNHRDEVYIPSWIPAEHKGRHEALWALGRAPDAPEPIGAQRARRLSLRRANPFLVAAGAVAPPSAPARSHLPR